MQYKQRATAPLVMLFIIMGMMCLSVSALFVYEASASAEHNAQETDFSVTLEEVLQFAMDHSVYGKLAATQRDIALQQALEADAALRPHITLDGNVTRLHQKETNDPLCIEIDFLNRELCLPTELLDVDVQANAATLQFTLRGPVFPTRFVEATRTLGRLGQH